MPVPLSVTVRRRLSRVLVPAVPAAIGGVDGWPGRADVGMVRTKSIQVHVGKYDTTNINSVPVVDRTSVSLHVQVSMYDRVFVSTTQQV